jgi:hypothetical protein
VSALTLDAMVALLGPLLRLLVSPASLRDIALENLALRQQLGVFKRKCPRPRLRRADRFLWVWLSKSWKDWRRALIIVRPETVVAWHRRGFCLFWTLHFQAQERPPRSQPRDSSSDPEDGRGQPAVGSAPHSWGAALAGNGGFRAHGMPTDAQVSEATFPDLEGFLE